MPGSIFGNKRNITFPEDAQPQLIVVVDTEEEFDWSASPDPKSVSVSAMEYIGRAQEIFDEYGITPCYVIDYPVASQPTGYSELVKIFQQNRCEIGAHLHPWVNEPLTEELCEKNTFPGNLPQELELVKLERLIEQIESVFDTKPVTYKAGRYGLGPNTANILSQLGFKIDLSSCPPIDYSPSMGPNYTFSQTKPFWFGEDDKLLEIPGTGAFVGWGGSHMESLYKSAEKYPQLRLAGILSRLGVVDRLRLSPEGYSVEEQIKLTNNLLSAGVRVFSWSFHSPSLTPGMTNYVKTDAELIKFLDSFRRYFDYFFNEINGASSTPTNIYNYCQSQLAESK